MNTMQTTLLSALENIPLAPKSVIGAPGVRNAKMERLAKQFPVFWAVVIIIALAAAWAVA